MDLKINFKNILSFDSLLDVPIYFTGRFVYNDGFYYKQNGEFHREDGPAIQRSDIQKWYQNGKLHRTDGPAIEKANGTKSWWINDQLHREDGPAVEIEDGGKEWYIHGKRHRIDGPAVDYKDKKIWYLNGKLHREDGPACEYDNSTQETPGGHVEASQEWYIHGKLHRTDGPAIIKTNEKSWWLNDSFYGNDFTYDSWIHFQKTLIF